jgi:hypothetical protein
MHIFKHILDPFILNHLVSKENIRKKIHLDFLNIQYFLKINLSNIIHINIH